VESLGSELRDRLLGAAIEGTGGIRYHLRDNLGEGGQGWVYKANYDDPDGFWIVVKVLRPEGVQSDSLKRFEREAEVLRMLGAVPAPNPNIVRFYDYGVHTVTTADGEYPLPFIALEYVEGQTLGKVIQAHGGFGLPVGRVRRVMKQVARALHTVHERRIVHRDLKPSNILLAQVQGQEVAKVTDFGLVKLPELSAHRTATVAGASLGYAPPEQYEMGNNRVTVQTDVFSFAAILFEALSGTEAFPFKPGDNPLRIVARMLSGDRPGLARVTATVSRELRDRPDLTAALDREIGRAVNADPAHRHATIRELWEQIEPLLREAGSRGSGQQPQASIEDPLTFEAHAALSRDSGGEQRSVRTDSSEASIREPERTSGPSNPAAMPEWRMVGRPMTGERLRSGVISADRSLVAAGAHGLYHFARGVWSALHLPSGIDARFIRGLARMRTGELLLYGDAGFLVTLSPAGVAERLPLRDRDVTLLGAHVDEAGIVLVGERLSRAVGVLIELPTGEEPEIRNVEGATRLHGVTRLASEILVACGVHGDLFTLSPLQGRREIAWGRTGHLYALAAAPDGGAFAVGSGGHALRIAAGPGAPTATLEAVQTTRDLTSVVVDGEGFAWAVGGQARLLQRRQGIWTRIPLDPIAQGPLVLVGPRPDVVTVLGEDGMVLEGRGIA